MRHPTGFNVVSPPCIESSADIKTILILLGCQRFSSSEEALFGTPEPPGHIRLVFRLAPPFFLSP